MKSGLSLVELAAEIERRANAKKDLVVSTKNVAMRPTTDSVELIVGDRECFNVNKVAHGQIAEHNEIPRRYYDKMLQEAPGLLANNVNEWFRKYPTPRLVRTLDGVNRAFLSDRYRPLENEDLAQATLPALGELGLDIHSCQITEQRLYIKAVDPKVQRELKAKGAAFGDSTHTIIRCLAPAITISNSEVGMGALSINTGVFDQWCSNLSTFSERSTRKYHVGAKHDLLGEEIYAMLSDETRRKTDSALWAQVGDVVRGAFDRARFDALCDKIAETQGHKIDGDPVKVVKLTTSRLGLNEADGTSILRHLIEGGDLSRFGLYNAVTAASQEVDDYDKATAMERGGAQIIELAASEWKELANAA